MSGLDIALPDGWVWSPLKYVTTFLNRGTAPDYVDNGAVRAVGQAANQADGLDWARTRYHDHDGDARRLKGYLTHGDVLINSTGTGTLGRVGYFAGGPDALPCVADGHVTVARADPKVIDSRFLFYWLRSRLFCDYIYSALIVGATNQIELNRERLAAAPTILPSADEQRRIAGFLDIEMVRIERLRALRGRVLSELQQRDQAIRDVLINNLFVEVGEVPLRRRLRLVEQGVSPPCFGYSRAGEEWGVIKLSAVKNGSFYPLENKKLPGEVGVVRQYEVRDGDLLVTRANTPELVGDAAVVRGAGRGLLLPDLIYRLVLDRGLTADFAAQVILSSRVRCLIRANARGSSQSMIKIRGEDIRDWPIPRADGRQQEELVSAIGSELARSDEVREGIIRQLSVLAERREALITAAVTGQIDVATARGVDV